MHFWNIALINSRKTLKGPQRDIERKGKEDDTPGCKSKSAICNNSNLKRSKINRI